MNAFDREYLQQIRATLRESLSELTLAIVTRATSETSVLVSMCRNDRRFSATGGRRIEHAPRDTEWNDTKNRRRCELVDKEIDGTITSDEQSELDELQAQMLAYRRKVAPLPLDDVRGNVGGRSRQPPGNGHHLGVQGEE